MPLCYALQLSLVFGICDIVCDDIYPKRRWTRETEVLTRIISGCRFLSRKRNEQTKNVFSSVNKYFAVLLTTGFSCRHCLAFRGVFFFLGGGGGGHMNIFPEFVLKALDSENCVLFSLIVTTAVDCTARPTTPCRSTSFLHTF